jgi:hypothetical protein
MLFSAMGFGFDVFGQFLGTYEYTYYCGGCVSGTFFLLYVLDFSYWPAYMDRVKYALYTVAAIAMVMASILSSKVFPTAPLGMFFMLVPLYIYGVKKFVFSTTPTANFLASMARSLMICSNVTFVVWIVWFLQSEEYWDNPTKEAYAARLECPLRVPVSEGGDGSVCLVAYLLWISPFMACIACFVFSLVCFYLSEAMFNHQGSGKKHMGVRAFVYFMMMLILGIWVAAGVAGAGMNLSNVVTIFTFIAMIILGVTVSSTLGWDTVKDNLMQIPFIQAIASTFLSDWVKAIGLCVGVFPFLMYLFVSMINQFIRKHLSIAKSLDSPEEGKYWFTSVATSQFSKIRNWNWTSIWVKCVYIDLFFLTVNVGIGKATTLFLSGLNGWLAANFDSTIVVVCIFYAVGLFMFLLPPVPGVPVYLAGGVILVNTLSPAPEREGFFPACFITCIIGFVIKLNAIAMQQKCFGEGMSNNLTVKCLVGVNSMTIKAIEKILKKPGLNLDKIAILVGGPDWPTSVLTGILKLKLSAMLFGSLPIIFLIMPCVFAGAFLLRAGDGSVWSALSSVTLAVAALTQTIALCAAMYYIEQTVHDNREELEAIPKDQEVQRVEEERRLKSINYVKLTHWHKAPMPVPFIMKLVLSLSGFVTTAACYLVFFSSYFLGEACFEQFEVTDSIDVDLAEELHFLGYEDTLGSLHAYDYRATVVDSAVALFVKSTEDVAGNRIAGKVSRSIEVNDLVLATGYKGPGCVRVNSVAENCTTVASLVMEDSVCATSEVCGGSALNMVKFYGWGAIFLMVLGILLLYIFKKWAGRRVRATQGDPATQVNVQKVVPSDTDGAPMTGVQVADDTATATAAKTSSSSETEANDVGPSAAKLANEVPARDL